ncbi:MAG: insulinase family protein [Chlorobi bacterium]|nr:insulinase family protein [Chlorobiota bacterium]
MRKRFQTDELHLRGSQLTESTTLPSGIRVITDYVPHVRSVALGVWLDCGSREDAIPGTAHALEHILFRRSRRYSGIVRSRVVESLGAYLNASTAKELTCYYVRGLAEHFDRLADVLLELVFAPAYTSADVAKERQIIVEEIRSYEDDPEEVVSDRLDELLFGAHSLARPIAGTLDSVERITPDVLEQFHRSNYVGAHTVVIVSGAIPHEHVVETVARLADRWQIRAQPEKRRMRRLPRQRPPGRLKIECAFQQTHCAYGIRTEGARSAERHALAILNILFGDSSSSRLYRRVRERQALAYVVYSSLQLWSDCGELNIYAGIRSHRIERAISAIEQEIKSLATVPPTQEEFCRARQQLLASLVMSMESLSARMHAIAHMVLVEHELQPLDAIVQVIKETSLEQVHAIARQLSDPAQWSCVLAVEKD